MDLNDIFGTTYLIDFQDIKMFENGPNNLFSASPGVS